MSDVTAERVLVILEATKKAVQMGNSVKPLNGNFVQAVKIDGQVYMVCIEKHISANETIEKFNRVLTKM